jgi:hypothetical protein
MNDWRPVVESMCRSRKCGRADVSFNEVSADLGGVLSLRVCMMSAHNVEPFEEQGTSQVEIGPALEETAAPNRAMPWKTSKAVVTRGLRGRVQRLTASATA